MYFVSPITNVDKSILRINLDLGFHIEEWSYTKYIQFHSSMADLAPHHIESIVHDGYYASRKKFNPETKKIKNIFNPPKNVYVITKKIDCSNPFSKEKVNLFTKHRRCEWVYGDINRQVHKLRLLVEGDIHVPACFFLTKEEPFFDSREKVDPCVGERAFKIKKGDIEHINEYMKHHCLNHQHSYLNLALNNFQKSYDINEPHLEFLILIIVLEGIFNYGRQESTQKVARGCAVLLGKTKPLSQRIFKDVKSLYAKRSRLLHEGDSDSIQDNDILLLKNYARKSLRHCLAMDLTKEELIKRLNESGFGSSRDFIGKGRTALQKNLFPILMHLH